MHWILLFALFELVYGGAQITSSSLKLTFLQATEKESWYSYSFFNGELVDFTCEKFPPDSPDNVRWVADVEDSFRIMNPVKDRAGGKLTLLLSSEDNEKQLNCSGTFEDEKNIHIVKFELRGDPEMEDRKDVILKGFDEHRLELIEGSYNYTYHFIPPETLTITCGKNANGNGFAKWSYIHRTLEINDVSENSSTITLTLHDYHSGKIILCNYYKWMSERKTYGVTSTGDVVSVFAYITFKPDGKVATTTTSTVPTTKSITSTTTKKATTAKTSTTRRPTPKPNPKPTTRKPNPKPPTHKPKPNKTPKPTTPKPTTPKPPTTVRTTSLQPSTTSTTLLETSDESSRKPDDGCGIQRFYITGPPELICNNGSSKFNAILEYNTQLDIALTCHKTFKGPGEPNPSFNLIWHFNEEEVGPTIPAYDFHTINNYTFSIHPEDDGKAIKCVYKNDESDVGLEVTIKLHYEPPPTTTEMTTLRTTESAARITSKFEDTRSRSSFTKKIAIFESLDLKRESEKYNVIKMNLELIPNDDGYQYFYCSTDNDFAFISNSKLVIRMEAESIIERHWCDVNNQDAIRLFNLQKNEDTFKEYRGIVSKSYEGSWNCTFLGYKDPKENYINRYTLKEGTKSTTYLTASCIFNVKIYVPSTASIQTPRFATNRPAGSQDYKHSAPSTANPQIIYSSVAGVVFCLILLILVILAGRRFCHRMKQEQREANEIMYENLSNENVSANQFPPNLEYTYARPYDSIRKPIDDEEPSYAVANYQGESPYTVPYGQDLSKLYAKPIPKSTRDMYAKPIPKSQRFKNNDASKDENPYAEIITPQLNYAEIETGSPKASVSRLKTQQTPYSKIIGIAKKKGKQDKNPGYSNVIKDKPDKDSGYSNVIMNDSRYANANDTEYAEPAYCEVKR